MPIFESKLRAKFGVDVSFPIQLSWEYSVFVEIHNRWRQTNYSVHKNHEVKFDDSKNNEEFLIPDLIIKTWKVYA